MIGIPSAIEGVSALLNNAINKIWPNPEDKAKAEAVAIQAAATAAITQLEAAQAVMRAEATSADPWTSRARPSFLYVVYAVILFALPMGLVSAVSPDTAQDIALGFKGWLAAIPKNMWDLFLFGYLGYSGSRTFEKVKRVAK